MPGGEGAGEAAGTAAFAATSAGKAAVEAAGWKGSVARKGSRNDTRTTLVMSTRNRKCVRAWPWKSGLHQYSCVCSSSCVSICTFVLANLVAAQSNPGDE
jgi:hypothetical protein